MNMQISENAPVRTIQHIIDEAKSLGLRVVHRPNQSKNNAISTHEASEQRRMQMCVSPEAA